MADQPCRVHGSLLRPAAAVQQTVDLHTSAALGAAALRGPPTVLARRAQDACHRLAALLRERRQKRALQPEPHGRVQVAGVHADDVVQPL